MKRRHPLASIANPISLLLLLSLTLILQACGGGGGGGPAATYKVGGTVAGLGDTPLILQNNGTGTLSVAQNGDYEFTTTLTEGTAYDVTILTQPDKYSCDISNGAGVVAKENIITINVNCSLIPTYTIGGNVTGLGSNSVVLQNNGSEQLTVSANGNYQFATALVEGAPYNVTILTQPSNYNCTITDGNSSSGTVASQNINTVAISCNVLPTGYYNNGTVSVMADDNITPLAFNDLQAMINGNRLMLMSDSQHLLYDGTFTNITGSSYSANVKIYKLGSLLTTATITGTLTGGSSMTGTLVGTKAGNGTFALTYAQSNSDPVDFSKIQLPSFNGDNGRGDTWQASVFGLGVTWGFAVDTDNLFYPIYSSTAGLTGLCTFTNPGGVGSSLNPIVGSRFYQADLLLSDCYYPGVSGNYTGLATMLSINAPNDTVLMAFTGTEVEAGFFALYTIVVR